MKQEDLKVGLQVTNVNGANGEIVEITEDKVFVQFAIDYVNEAPTPFSIPYFLKVFMQKKSYLIGWIFEKDSLLLSIEIRNQFFENLKLGLLEILSDC